MKRTCLFCGKEFEIKTEGSGGHNRNTCYECLPSGVERQERKRIRQRLLIQKSNEYKLSIGCQRCGYNNSARALDWHHTDSNKDLNPAESIKRSWDEYLKETEKCVLLCANCHREIHEELGIDQ